MKWSAPIVRNLGLVLTKFAAVIASFVPVSLIWNEYYAIPGELLAAAIVYGIGWMLSRGESKRMTRPPQRPSRPRRSSGSSSALWLMSLFAGVFLLLVVLPSETSLEHALFEVASAQGNVGLSSGITGPDAPASAKLILIGNMWLGRLTIIPVLVFLRGTV